MKNSRNRLTPILIFILLLLVWILIIVLAYKFINNHKTSIKKLKLTDPLVAELYSYVTDDDIFFYSKKAYDSDNLPDEYLISKASRYLTVEDIEFVNNKEFIISYESLDNAIKMAFGPDFKYDLSKINTNVLTSLSLKENSYLNLNIHYDSKSNNYLGNYVETEKQDKVKVYHKLVEATKTDTVNLKIGYLFYIKDNQYQICSDESCLKVVKQVSSLKDIDFDKFITINLKKASDEVYYYQSNI